MAEKSLQIQGQENKYPFQGGGGKTEPMILC